MAEFAVSGSESGDRKIVSCTHEAWKSFNSTNSSVTKIEVEGYGNELLGSLAAEMVETLEP